jgi:hypothetical protein
MRLRHVCISIAIMFLNSTGFNNIKIQTNENAAKTYEFFYVTFDSLLKQTAINEINHLQSDLSDCLTKITQIWL